MNDRSYPSGIQMPSQTLTLQLPENLYHRLKERADRSRRSVEEESLQLLNASAPGSELPEDLAQALDDLQVLDEPDLWEAARSRLSTEGCEELEALNTKQRRDGLTASEKERQNELVTQYERLMLVRARAAVLLKNRGHDISCLLSS